MIQLRKNTLPELEKVKKYFEQIDQNKYYSNRGPLVLELEKRLANHFEINEDRVVVMCNATASLHLGLLDILSKVKNKEKRFCLCPSYTFAGTPVAINLSGLEPYFVDIDNKSGNLTPQIIIDKFGTDFSKVAAIMPVSCFGTKLDTKAWNDFSKQYEVEIIADQAWCYDNYQDFKNNYSAISLHCSKVLGCGEGGILIVPGLDEKKSVIELSNFGFNDEKIANTRGTNAKMSEYSAAVCHAAMDQWPEIKQITIKLQKKYIKEIKKIKNISLFYGLEDSWCWMSCAIRVPQELRESIQKNLETSNIESRVWWLGGCHKFPAFIGCKKTDLTNTNELAKEVLNIPFHSELVDEDIKKITNCLN